MTDEIEIGRMVTVSDGDVTVELEWLGEGTEGDFDPTWPEDEPLMRFTVLRRVDGVNEQIDDASYCTTIRADAPQDVLLAYANEILQEVAGPVRDGWPIKKLCAKLSWIGTDRIGQSTV
jgi:hypothetical protein